MLHIPVSQIFIRLSVRFNPKQKTSTFDPFMDLFLYTCPLILSEFFPSLFCGGCSRRPPAALTQNSGWPSFREAQFDPQPVFFLLTRIRPGQSRRKPPSPCYHRHPSLFALSFIWRLSVLNTSQPEQNTEVNHHHRPWTPCYIPKDTRESLGKWSLLSPHAHTQLEICFKCGVVRYCTFPTQRTNPALGTTPQLLPAHISWSFFKEPNRKLVTSVLALWAHSHLHIHSMLLFDWEHSLSQRKIAGGVVSKELL